MKKKSGSAAKKSTHKPAPKPLPKAPALPIGWYLMLQPELTVEEIQTALSQEFYETEIWKEAGVLEVILKEKCSLDLESCPIDMQDEYSNAFLEEHRIHSLFYASFPDEAYEEAKAALLHILTHHAGLVCADTDDFTPRIEN